jgi:hypothetical protein
MPIAGPAHKNAVKIGAEWGEFEEDVMRITVSAALALVTAACGGGGQNQAAPAANAANAVEPAGNQVAALSEGQRNAVFIRAIRDAGLDCQHVDSAVSVDAGFNLPTWRATCQGGGEYMITIGPDGSAQVQSANSATGGNQAAAPAGNRQD